MHHIDPQPDPSTTGSKTAKRPDGLVPARPRWGTARAFVGAILARLRHPAILVIALGFAVTACSSSEPATTTASSPVPTTAKVSKRDVRVIEEFDGILGFSDERPIVYQAEQPVEASTTGAAAGPTGAAPSGSPASAAPGGASGTAPEGGTGQPGSGGPAATTTTPQFGGLTTTSTTTTAPPATTSTTTSPAADTGTARTVSFVSLNTAAQSGPSSDGGTGQATDKTVTSVAAVGSAVGRGQVLYRVDDQPTFLMIGTAPAYRELSTDASDGSDVRQLEENLVELGFGGDLTVDDDFTSATASAVADWEDSVGLDGDGIVELGQIVFTDGPVQVRSITSPVGSMVSIGTEIMTVSSNEPVVTISATLPETTNLPAGTSVDVNLGDGTVVPGTVVSVGRETTTADGADVTDSTVELTVSLDDATGTDEAAMAGAVTVRATITDHPDVLTVPTSAVMTANGRPVVHVVKGAGADATASVVQVTVGASANGFVEISGAGVAEGDRVSLVPAASGS